MKSGRNTPTTPIRRCRMKSFSRRSAALRLSRAPRSDVRNPAEGHLGPYFPRHRATTARGRVTTDTIAKNATPASPAKASAPSKAVRVPAVIGPAIDDRHIGCRHVGERRVEIVFRRGSAAADRFQHDRAERGVVEALDERVEQREDDEHRRRRAPLPPSSVLLPPERRRTVHRRICDPCGRTDSRR